MGQTVHHYLVAGAGTHAPHGDAWFTPESTLRDRGGPADATAARTRRGKQPVRAAPTGLNLGEEKGNSGRSSSPSMAGLADLPVRRDSGVSIPTNWPSALKSKRDRGHSQSGRAMPVRVALSLERRRRVGTRGLRTWTWCLAAASGSPQGAGQHA